MNVSDISSEMDSSLGLTATGQCETENRQEQIPSPKLSRPDDDPQLYLQRIADISDISPSSTHQQTSPEAASDGPNSSWEAQPSGSAGGSVLPAEGTEKIRILSEGTDKTRMAEGTAVLETDQPSSQEVRATADPHTVLSKEKGVCAVVSVDDLSRSSWVMEGEVPHSLLLMAPPVSPPGSGFARTPIKRKVCYRQSQCGALVFAVPMYSNGASFSLFLLLWNF